MDWCALQSTAFGRHRMKQGAGQRACRGTNDAARYLRGGNVSGAFSTSDESCVMRMPPAVDAKLLLLVRYCDEVEE